MSKTPRRTGYVFHELFIWHDAGPAVGWHPVGLWPQKGIYNQPGLFHNDHPDSKRRIHSLLAAAGILDVVKHLHPVPASEEQLQWFHTAEYINRFRKLSEEKGGDAGRMAPMGPGTFHIAKLAVGAAFAAVDSVLSGQTDNAYALVRPAGHHAERDRGMGFTFFANVALGAMHAQRKYGLKKVAIVDIDVHHGNGTQQAFYSDPSVLTISLHQANLYPYNTGWINEHGDGKGVGYNINIPFPPGSGAGAYLAAFDRVVLPALDAFQPELVMMASGFDAGAFDPMARMMLSSTVYRTITAKLMAVADTHAQGRFVCVHEGGYSPFHAPYCGLAVLEQLTGYRSPAKDPFASYVDGLSYQDLQANQNLVIEAVEGMLGKHLFRATSYSPGARQAPGANITAQTDSTPGAALSKGLQVPLSKELQDLVQAGISPQRLAQVHVRARL